MVRTGENFFDYQARRELPRTGYSPLEPERPPEPMKVHEFESASTTVVERIREALRKRLRGEHL